MIWSVKWEIDQELEVAMGVMGIEVPESPELEGGQGTEKALSDWADVTRHFIVTKLKKGGVKDPGKKLQFKVVSGGQTEGLVMSKIKRLVEDLKNCLREDEVPQKKWDVSVELMLTHWDSGSRSEVSSRIRRTLDGMGLKGAIDLSKSGDGDEWDVTVSPVIKDQVDAPDKKTAERYGFEIGQEALDDWDGEGKVLSVRAVEAGQAAKPTPPKPKVDLEKAVVELEKIRSRGLFNMMDMDRVLGFAERVRSSELAKLSELDKDERIKAYSDLLQLLGQVRGSMK